MTLDLAAINLHAGLSTLTGLTERIAALTVALAATQERLERVAA